MRYLSIRLTVRCDWPAGAHLPKGRSCGRESWSVGRVEQDAQDRLEARGWVFVPNPRGEAFADDTICPECAEERAEAIRTMKREQQRVEGIGAGS